MITSLTLLKKTIVGLFVLCFAFTAVYIPQLYGQKVPNAYAQPAQLGVQLIELAEEIYEGFVNTASLAYDKLQTYFAQSNWLTTNTLNGLAWQAAKAIIAKIQQSLVRWINSGFQGSPAFIQDFGGFLTEVADETAGRFIQEVGGPLSIVCSPFRLNVQIALSVSYNRTRDKNARRCTLTGALQNIQNFIGGDFSQGGWNSWLQITQNPSQYTQAGSLLDASAEMNIGISSAQGRASIPLNWGRGFLSSKVCDEPASPTGSGDGTSGQGQGAQQAKPNCRVSTPGDVISNQINRTLGLSGDTLVAADQINEVIGALMQQLVVQALSGANGLLGMGGAQGSNAQWSNPTFNVNNYDSEIASTGSVQSFLDIINKAIAVETSYRDLALSTISRYEKSYTTDPAVQSRADGAYNEARSVLPSIEANLAEAKAILAEITAAPSIAAQQNVVNKYLTVSTKYHTEVDVSANRDRWNYSLSGMIPRDESTIDRRAMVEQVALEREYLNLINAAIDEYETIGSPSPNETAAYNEAQKVLPTVQDNIITVQDLIGQYDAGNTDDALADYSDLRPNLSTESDVDDARADWETVFGPLP